jgi:phosphoglycolate phosphatase-like HAD superfamily hydrolase
MIFDLDGTLVQTERLKAISYARAAIELSPKKLIEEEVIEASSRPSKRSSASRARRWPRP